MTPETAQYTDIFSTIGLVLVAFAVLIAVCNKPLNKLAWSALDAERKIGPLGLHNLFEKRLRALSFAILQKIERTDDCPINFSPSSCYLHLLLLLGHEANMLQSIGCRSRKPWRRRKMSLVKS